MTFLKSLKNGGGENLVTEVEKSVLLCSTDLRRMFFGEKLFRFFFSNPIFCGQKNPFSVVLITGLCSFELKTSF